MSMPPQASSMLRSLSLLLLGLTADGKAIGSDELPDNGDPASELVAAAEGAPPRCALTIDVEDWYQSSVDHSAPITERVLRNVARVCSLLAEMGVRGTFFVQG